MKDFLTATVPWAFLGISVIGAAFTINTFSPIRHFRVLVLQGFFQSWLTNELTLYMIFWQAVGTAVFAWFGALDAWPGWVGLAICFVSWMGMFVLWARGKRTEAQMDAALVDLDVRMPSPRVPDSKLWTPFAMSRVGVKRTRNVEFGAVGRKQLLLDVYEPDGDGGRTGTRRPAIIQIHGGGWVIGDKREQGLPLLNHLAVNGWVGFNVNYRLSPRAVFPDHLIDIKRAIAWIRAHADEYNIDPEFVVVTGGSAGGHLTALTALTQNDPLYQPGFESADTSVQGAVPFYGVYCFSDRDNLCMPGFRGFIERTVMKVRVSTDPEAFRLASPLDRVGDHAPPFFVIHGDRDSLAPVGYARQFVAKLREFSPEPVAYAELRGAQHAFDIFYSPRASRAIEGVEHFVTALHQRYLDRKAGGASATPAP